MKHLMFGTFDHVGRIVTHVPGRVSRSLSRNQIRFPQRPQVRSGLAALLRPESAVVPFFGREPQFEALTSWCESSAVSDLALIIGEPGVGKTRLVLEFAQRMKMRGWQCALLPTDLDDVHTLISAMSDESILFIADDADRQSIDISAVMRCVKNQAREIRFRLVVAGRSTGAWWEPLRIGAGNLPINWDRALAVELKAIHDDGLKERLFGNAVSAFSEQLHVDVPRDTKLPETKYDSTLMLLAAALMLAWDRKAPDELNHADQQQLGGTAVLDYLLARESRFRARQAGIDSDAGSDALLLRMMAVAGILQITHDDASEDLLRRVSSITGFDIVGRKSYAEWLLNFQAPNLLDTSAGRLPVSITENLIIRSLESDSRFAYEIADYLDEGQAERLLLALGRAQWHPSAERAIANVIDAKPETMLTAAFALGGQVSPLVGKVVNETLTSTKKVEFEQIIKLGSLVDPKSAVLLPASVVVCQRLTAAYPKELPVHAHWLEKLAACLVNLGRPKEALEHSFAAVWAYRIYSAKSSFYRAHLAGSLNTLSACYDALDRTVDAVDAVIEAIDQYRRCPGDSDDLLVGRSAALDSLARRLVRVGRKREALVAARESVEMLRNLSRPGKEEYLPNLAASLISLGACLAVQERSNEALDAVSEATAIYRESAESHPNSYLPHLAISLNDLGVRLASMGRVHEALETTTEAVRIRRELAASAPEIYLPDLAASLNNLGSRLAEMGRAHEALETIEEAVEIQRKVLEESFSDLSLSGLAAFLNALASRQAQVSRINDALEAVTEAVKIRRQLVRASPDIYMPDLAASLNNLGSCLNALGRPDAALEVVSEATGLYRKCAEFSPDAYLPDLAAALNNLELLLRALERPVATASSVQETLQTIDSLVGEQSTAALPRLASSLRILANNFMLNGPEEAAISAMEECVSVRRELAATHPDLYLPSLAATLYDLARLQQRLQRPDDCVLTAREAGELYGQLSTSQPQRFAKGLARSLELLAEELISLKRMTEARQSISKAVRLRRHIAAADPTECLELAGALKILGDLLEKLDRKEGARIAFEQVKQIEWQVGLIPAAQLSLGPPGRRDA